MANQRLNADPTTGYVGDPLHPRTGSTAGACGGGSTDGATHFYGPLAWAGFLEAPAPMPPAPPSPPTAPPPPPISDTKASAHTLCDGDSCGGTLTVCGDSCVGTPDSDFTW